MQDLVDVLQRERGLLEQLRYRFVALELLLEARESRLLGWATEDVERARRAARETDLVRAAIVGQMNLKGARGIPSLREVAAVAASPWASMLRDHHDGLASVVTEIELHGHRIAQSCRDGLAEIARTDRWGPSAPVEAPAGIAAHGGGAGGATATLTLVAPGQAPAPDPASVEILLHEVLAGGGRLHMPALLAFLR